MPKQPKFSPDIPDDKIPEFARNCFRRWEDATKDVRDAYKENLGFYVGGKLQWREGETEERQGNQRPWMTVNLCRPAVDQVANEALNNPPGPEALPVGGGADKDDADILEGMIREYEYRSNAPNARYNALKYAAAGGQGVWVLETEYADEVSFEQQLKVRYVHDPSNFFTDPDARMPARQDARWAGELLKYTREQLIEEFGSDLKVLQRNSIQNILGSAGGWIAEQLGILQNYKTAIQWAGNSNADGPFYVCKFDMIRIEQCPLRLYTDNILRFDDQPVTEGVTRVESDDQEVMRMVPRRHVMKYVVTAFDLLKKTEWYGSIIPHFWIQGPEIWIDGKLYRLCLIDGAKDAQRGLNYTATSAAEIIGSMTKSPFIGFEGQFDVTNAQGFNPWDNSNRQMFMYMEVKPTFATDDSGVQHLLPLPQRNTWEAPIARLMELATWFGEQIKAATSVFFEPSLPSARAVQSGTAIEALQQQSNVGTINWQKALQNTVELEYQQAAIILPKLYDGERVRAIVRPDTQHEVVQINREFPPHEIDQDTGKWKNPKTGKLESKNNIAFGKFSLRVMSGPSTATRNEESIRRLTEVFKIVPQLLGSPVVTSRFLRMVGEGNPEVESLADAIMPIDSGQATPEQIQAQLQQLGQQNKAKDFIISKLQMMIQAKLPEIEAKRWQTGIDALTKISVAEINASKDTDTERANRLADRFEQMFNMAHESTMQAVDHAHEKDLAEKQVVGQMAQNQQQADLAPEPTASE